MYYIYHIPKRKEWGCTKFLEKRVKKLGYTISDIDRVILVSDIDKAADMERDLNIEYGYGWHEYCDYRHLIKIGNINASRNGGHRGGKIGGVKGTKAIIAYCKKNKSVIKEFNSITEACKELNVNLGCVANILKGKRKSAKGYYFEYKK